MNRWTSPKPSVEELLRGCDSVLIAGCGGGGDLVQSVSIMNYAKTLGVKHIFGHDFRELVGHLC